ncbi:MAG TPA: POTRA domain-containing protein [Candidatus Angelobacter sp.]|nr:POTRA domain-containing protein [Candidatus Angelobacter sp.]
MLFFFCLLVSTASEAAPEQYHLVRILVQGSKRYATADIIRATGLSADSKVTIADLQNAATRMGGYGAFSSVKYFYKPAIGTDGIEAEFQVKDEEQILPAAFDNFLWFTPGQLKTAIHNEVPLFDGSIPNTGSLISSVVNALQKLLAAKGIPNEVSYALQQDTIGKPPKAYLFRVENPGLKIREFNFLGAKQIDVGLLKQATTRFKAREYSSAEMEDSLANSVIPVYRQRGFVTAVLGEINPHLNEGGAVDVDVHITEGDQYRLGKFQWSGNTLITSDELSKRITLKTGELVDGPKLDHDLGLVREVFGRFGRQGATIAPLATYSAGTVNYNFQVTEGELYHMGKLEIVTPNPQHRDVVLSHWTMAEGAPYNSLYTVRFQYQFKGAFAGQVLRWQTEELTDPENKVVNVRLIVQLSDHK